MILNNYKNKVRMIILKRCKRLKENQIKCLVNKKNNMNKKYRNYKIVL